MRRRDLDELTDREREVLELLRRDFTNEQIAQRLGITLDGAKYHVSQILSKLGVATREEAAAWWPEQRRAWWAQWPVWARITGAATAAAVVAGLAVLALGIIDTSGSTSEGEVLVASTPSGSAASCVMPSAIPPSSGRSVDEIFAAIGREVPGFAGFYFTEDGRTLMAALKEPVSEPDALCQSMARQSGMPRLANLTVRSVYAQYSFLELQGWYRPVQESLSIPEVVRSDIDEVRNRIVIGVETDEAREAVAQLVEDIGVPTEAVIIEHAEPVVTN